MVSPVFIVLYMRRKWWGISATFLGIAASTAAMAVGTYARGWSAMTLDGSWVVKYSEETYTTPYFRIVSYLVGMLFAMLWHEKQVCMFCSEGGRGPMCACLRACVRLSLCL